MKEIKRTMAAAAVSFTFCSLVLLWSEPNLTYRLLASVFIISGTLIAKWYGELK